MEHWANNIPLHKVVFLHEVRAFLRLSIRKWDIIDIIFWVRAEASAPFTKWVQKAIFILFCSSSPFSSREGGNASPAHSRAPLCPHCAQPRSHSQPHRGTESRHRRS